MDLWELLDPRCVQLALRARRKREAIEELVSLLHAAGKVAEKQQAVSALLEREKISSTGVGTGIAIPHAALRGFTRTALALGRKVAGIPFDSVDRQPVTLIFLMLGPEGERGEHLRLLSRLSRLLHDQGFVAELLAAPSPEKVIEVLRRKEGA